MSVGGCFGAAVDKDGLLWTWGSNSSGELGLGDYEARPYPYPVIQLKNKMI
jgi:alpha-tubulin suppressor-like RCC1 family protein